MPAVGLRHEHQLIADIDALRGIDHHDRDRAPEDGDDGGAGALTQGELRDRLPGGPGALGHGDPVEVDPAEDGLGALEQTGRHPEVAGGEGPEGSRLGPLEEGGLAPVVELERAVLGADDGHGPPLVVGEIEALADAREALRLRWRRGEVGVHGKPPASTRAVMATALLAIAQP